MTQELHGEDAQLAGLQEAADATRTGDVAERLDSFAVWKVCSSDRNELTDMVKEVAAVVRALTKQRESTAFWEQQFNHEREEVKRLAAQVKELQAPIPMLLACPDCAVQHVDEGEWATRPHHIHLCEACGHMWGPAVRATVGVRSLSTPVCTVPKYRYWSHGRDGSNEIVSIDRTEGAWIVLISDSGCEIHTTRERFAEHSEAILP